MSGLSSLNLSLDGRSIKSAGSEARKIPTDRRSNLDNAKTSTNKIPPSGKLEKSVSSARENSSYRMTNRKPILDRNVFLKGKEEEKKKLDESEPKDSYIFKPLSQRSSIDDETGILPKTTPKSDPLDIFFRSDSDSNEFEKNKSLNDEKLNKLKESTENLRRQLQLDTANLTNRAFSNTNKQLKNEPDKHAAAAKIQKWYRKNQNTRRTQNQEEIRRLLKEKNTEMVKKLEKFNQMSLNESKKPKTYVVNRKQLSSDRIQLTKTSKKPVDPKQESLFAKEKPSVESVSDSVSTLTSEKFQIEPLKATVDQKTQSSKNSTIEDLLMDLEKIDRDSEMMVLNSDSGKNRSQRGNSLLEFLDEIAKKETSMTPRAVKDLKSIENDALLFLQNNQMNSLTSERPLTGRKTKEKTEDPPKPLTQKTTDKKTASAKNSDKSDSVSEDLLNKAKSIQNDLKSKISVQNLEIDEKNKIISKLERDLSQQRELVIRHAQEADKEMQLRLEAQKNDYEAAIQRHLNFIDQLIDDKKVLSEKCEKLVNELKDVEKRYTDKIRTMEDKFKSETQKMKDTLEAAEKLRREKWIEEKTKKIKEMTVKGLEPEIQALINKHKNEIKSMKAIHEAELMQADERAAQRYIKITEELRENYEREKEAAIQREREVSKQRYEKSLQDEENSFLEQRRRLYAEVEEEKNRLAEQAAQQRRDLDRQRKMLDENNLNAIEAIKKEYSVAQKEAEKKYLTEIQNLKEKLDIEKQSWEQNFLKKQENWMIQKERELRDQIKKERDKEIETLLARLDSESTMTREEIERTAENRVKRIRDKYESELREVEKTERETMERYNGLKAKFNEMEGEYERLKTVVRQKEKDLEGIKKLTDTLQDERNRLADVLRQEFADRIVFAEEENKKLKLEIAEMKSKYQYDQEKKKEEIEKLERDNTEELNKVHEKIKQVVSKKDEAYNQLKQQYDAACKRADHLEGLLEQQRALMLKKTNENK